MKLETISAIAQLLAAIGVIVSLFYLAAQIRVKTCGRPGAECLLPAFATTSNRHSPSAMSHQSAT